MGKNKSRSLNEDSLVLPPYPSGSRVPIVDTHTHLISTFSAYRAKFKDSAKYASVYDFVRGIYASTPVEAIIDVWCEAPVQKAWREVADSALTEEGRAQVWGGIEYWFVMGVHPLEAMTHPRCVGWGEIGLDYHYDISPREKQQEIFIRQLRLAVAMQKPITVHTREAEEDTERILKAEMPKEHKIHIHCFTDTPAFAQRLLDHFPNLYIGITGVITYSTNLNTPALVRELAAQPNAPRIVLETDAPYMIPSNLYASLTSFKGRLPLCHTGMIPWTAEFVAGAAGEGWDTDKVLQLGRENARAVYGV
ncbi:hypothetical protein EWM64_g99 [Hericium alpestre]|uniref:Amidohydrolase-related domain-containing protein n=1 Tax=Hericium alpestre TaxID=135208 RepID=A0A4Z0AAX6_9AGAM|nr:hypothetical protein EWM64_g99 [Hericium alpestre]